MSKRRQTGQPRVRSDGFARLIPRNRQRLEGFVVKKQCEILRALRLELFQAFLNHCDGERCARALFKNDRRAAARALNALNRSYWEYIAWIEETRLRVLVLDAARYPFVIGRASAGSSSSPIKSRKDQPYD